MKKDEAIKELLKQRKCHFEFPQDSKIKIPEKYNEEWLRTSTMEDKIKFLNEFMNGFNDAYEQPKLYVKDTKK